MNGVEFGFEIALGFVLFAVVCITALAVLGLVVRLPIWFLRKLSKEIEATFTRKRLREFAIGISPLLGLLVIVLIWSVFSGH